MSSLRLSSENTFLKFNPLTLLAQIAGQKTTGCLMIYSGAQAWKLYLEDGDLIYASAVQQAFDRLERHLRQLGRTVPSLVSAVRVQVRLLFETRQSGPTSLSPDYQAIQWLLEQQYLTPAQAANLIESLARESLQSLLAVTSGSYDIVAHSQLEDWFTVCRLDLRQLIESCEPAEKAPPRLGVVEGGAPVVPFVPSAVPPVQGGGTGPFSGRSPSQGQREEPRSPQVAPESTPPPFRSPAVRNSAIPYSPPSISAPSVPNNPAPPAATVSSQPRQKRYRVVCVDDSPSILKLIHSYLEEDDFSVFMINDPVRALMQVVRCQPDLVLLDVEMPNLDGYELCSLLRRHPAFKSVPIVMVTGNTGFIDRARAKLVGASGYLTKPFSRSELLKIIFRNLPVQN